MCHDILNVRDIAVDHVTGLVLISSDRLINNIIETHSLYRTFLYHLSGSTRSVMTTVKYCVSQRLPLPLLLYCMHRHTVFMPPT